jgi:hypothetical protein
MDALIMISGFRRAVAENCVLAGYYAASSGNFLSTFRDNLPVPYSRVKNPRRTVDFLPYADGTDGISRNAGIGITATRCVTSKKNAFLMNVEVL